MFLCFKVSSGNALFSSASSRPRPGVPSPRWSAGAVAFRRPRHQDVCSRIIATVDPMASTVFLLKIGARFPLSNLKIGVFVFV